MVYSPLWVDEFAPPSSRTSWMSFLQAGVPVGVMLGYLIATVATSGDASTCWPGISCWRFPFLLQFMTSLPLACAAFAVPSEHLDTRLHRHDRLRAVSLAQREINDELTRRLRLLFPGSTEVLPSPTITRGGNSNNEGTPFLSIDGVPVHDNHHSKFDPTNDDIWYVFFFAIASLPLIVNHDGYNGMMV
jgi:MFS family permease